MKQKFLLAGALCVALGTLSCSSTSKKPWSPSNSSSGTASSTKSMSGSSDTKMGSDSNVKGASTTSTGSAPTISGKAVSATLALPTGDKSTSTVMLEKVAPREIQAGAPFEYGIKVTNLTSLSLEGVTVSESIPSGMNVSSSSPKASKSMGGTMEFALGDIGPKSSKMITVSGTAKDTGTLTTCSNVTYNTGVCLAMNVIRPALSLVASGPATGTPCDELEYRYVVSNTGSGMASNVVVDAVLPTGLMTLDSKSSVKKTIGNLDSGDSREFMVKAKAGKTGTLAHSASATAEGGLSTKSGSVSTAITQPMLKVAVTGPGQSFSGRSVNYEVTVTNTGNGVAENAMISAAIPSSASFKSATDGGKFSGGAVKWALGNLAPNATRKVSMKVGGSNGQLVVNSSANADCADMVRSSATTSITGIPAILLEVVDLTDPIEVGSNATYTVRVFNQGTADDADISIICELPPNVTFVSASGATNATTSGRTVTFNPLPVLSPKKEAMWTIIVRGDSGADARFRVAMRSLNLKSPVEESEATTYYE